jgi:hypothetical protein
MSNGMPIIVNGVMKPIPTLYKPLNSVDIKTKEDFISERSIVALKSSLVLMSTEFNGLYNVGIGFITPLTIIG